MSCPYTKVAHAHTHIVFDVRKGCSQVLLSYFRFERQQRQEHHKLQTTSRSAQSEACAFPSKPSLTGCGRSAASSDCFCICVCRFERSGNLKRSVMKVHNCAADSRIKRPRGSSTNKPPAFRDSQEFAHWAITVLNIAPSCLKNSIRSLGSLREMVLLTEAERRTSQNCNG